MGARRAVSEKIEWRLVKSDWPNAVRPLLCFHPSEKFSVGDNVRVTVTLLERGGVRRRGKGRRGK